MKKEITNEILKATLNKWSEKELDLLEGQAGEHDFSDEFMVSMEEIMSKSCEEKKKKEKKKRLMPMKLIAIAAALLLFVFSNADVRNYFLNMTIETNEKNTNISIVTLNEMEVEMELARPRYVPDGFKIVEEDKTDRSIRVIYKNKNDEEIFYWQNEMLENAHLSIDTEDTKLETLEINGQEVYYFYNKNEHTFFWFIYNNMFEITSSYSREELEKMVESLIE